MIPRPKLTPPKYDADVLWGAVVNGSASVLSDDVGVLGRDLPLEECDLLGQAYEQSLLGLVFGRLRADGPGMAA